MIRAIPAGWAVVAGCNGIDSTTQLCDDTEAQPGITYAYRVFGWSTADGSTAGGWDQGVSSIGDSGYRLAPLNTAPQNLTATTDRSDAVLLNWSAFSGASSFEIMSTTTDVARTQVGGLISVTPGLATTYTDSIVPRGAGRCYKVRGVNAAGSGPWSNEACGFRIGLDPAVLTASQGTVTSATRLTWVHPTTYTPVRSEIRRLRSTSNLSDWELIADLPGTVNSYDDTTARGADIVPNFYWLHQMDADGNVTRWSMSSTTSFSANVAQGWANVAPSSASLSASISAGVLAQLPAPVVVDGNVGDVFTLYLSDPASARASTLLTNNGATVTLTSSGNFTYAASGALALSPPTLSSNSEPHSSTLPTTDSFVFWVTDRAGASAKGLATVAVCPRPRGSVTAATTAAPLQVKGSSDTSPCNGPVSVRFELLRVAGSSSAGNNGGPANNENVAATTQYPVAVGQTQQPALLSAPYAFSATSEQRSGLYELRAIFRDTFGAQSASTPFSLDLPCLPPTMTIAPMAVNYKRSRSLISTTLRQTDLCQVGLTYSLALTSVAAPTKALQPLVPTWPEGAQPFTAVNADTPVVWAGSVEPNGAYVATLTATGQTGVVAKRVTKDIEFACPLPAIVGAAATARSALTEIEIAVSRAPCAPRVDQLTLNPTSSSSVVLALKTVGSDGVDIYVATVAYPARDSSVQMPITISLVGGEKVIGSLAVTYDARTVTPLYTATYFGAAASSAVSTPSLGRIILTPNK